MNGFTEPLPGLLDDPQFQIPNLPSLTDVHIAPLRNPAPLRNVNAPLPLEPLANSLEDRLLGPRKANQLEDEPEKTSPPRLRPSDVLSAREAKKPHLAISELLEASNDDADSQHLQLPSFVSLAVVEKSPIQEPSRLSPHKRLRLDLDVDGATRDVGRRLPRPAQKDDKQQRPVPLLPAMVTGLHEPPPSAGILPSMDLDAYPNLTRTSKTSKMQVKNILAESKRSSTHVPPEAMLNTPDLAPAELAKPMPDESRHTDNAGSCQMHEALGIETKKDTKIRRARRKWTEEETADLLAGVQKHGFGKWKQILTDPAFAFHDRTSIDLKDRYRVYVKDEPESNVAITQLQNQSQSHIPPPKADTLESIGTNFSHKNEQVSDIAKTKRKRRPWTPAEDAALMSGLSKYGFQWTAIHDDPELDLKHRRATDLRDRIRNLYPEGYKQAEARPLRSEAKKPEKPIADLDLQPPEAKASSTSSGRKASDITPQKVATELAASSQVKRSIRRSKAHKASADVHQAAESVGVTLPSLALDDDNELDWEDNTLPPLLEWDDIGIE